MKKRLRSMAGIFVLAWLMCFIVAMTVFADKPATGDGKIAYLQEFIASEDVGNPDDVVQGDGIQEDTAQEDVILGEDEIDEEAVLEEAETVGNRSARIATDANAEFIPVENPRWEDIGRATWDQDYLTEEQEKEVRVISVEIFKDGECIGRGEYDLDNYGADVRYHFREAGDYTFRASYIMTEDWRVPEDGYSELSEVCPYTPPAKKMDTPVGLEWLNDGRVKWEAVTSGTGKIWYVTELYEKNMDTGDYQCIESGGLEKRTVTTRFIRKMKEGGTYKFRIMALGDLTEYANSDISAYSKPFYLGDIADQGNGIIGDLNQGDVKENIENADLSEDDKGALKLAIQTDAGVARNYGELEEAYKENAGKNDLSVETGTSGVDAGKVEVIGGILNGATGITFDEPGPEDLDDVNITNYKRHSAINISLEGDVSGELKFPVLITMPVPEGIVPGELTIIHIKQDGTKEEIEPRINADGTASFAVTEFSTFLFVNEKPEGGDIGGGGGSSGGGSSSGGQSAAKSDSFETAGTWIEDANGWWFQKLDGTYPVSVWLMNGGNWYRFDERGYMLTGWFTDADGKRFYLNPISDGNRGAMKTSWQLIDGKWYYFNQNSDGTKGALLVQTTTPDGYSVDADGVWAP